MLHSTPPHARYSILPYNGYLLFPCAQNHPITHPIRIRAIQYWRLQNRSLIHTKASPPIFFLFKLTNWQWFSQPGWQPPVQPGPTTKASWCALPKEALLRILDAIGPKWNMSDLTGIIDHPALKIEYIHLCKNQSESKMPSPSQKRLYQKCLFKIQCEGQWLSYCCIIPMTDLSLYSFKLLLTYRTLNQVKPTYF